MEGGVCILGAIQHYLTYLISQQLINVKNVKISLNGRTMAKVYENIENIS